MPNKSSLLSANNEQNNKYLIYCYTSPSGKKYIGQTINENNRKSYHRNATGHTCRAFSEAIKKYGFYNISYEVLERNLTLEEANEKEDYYINFFNTLSPNGYNLRSGGNNWTPSKETLEKMSIASSGRKLSDESKEKISKAHKGKPKSESARENMRLAQSRLSRIPIEAIKKSAELRKGKSLSQETKQKLSLIQKGKPKSQQMRDRLSASKKGHIVSIETREKLRIANLGKKRSAEL